MGKNGAYFECRQNSARQFASQTYTYASISNIPKKHDHDINVLNLDNMLRLPSSAVLVNGTLVNFRLITLAVEMVCQIQMQLETIRTSFKANNGLGFIAIYLCTSNPRNTQIHLLKPVDQEGRWTSNKPTYEPICPSESTGPLDCHCFSNFCRRRPGLLGTLPISRRR